MRQNDVTHSGNKAMHIVDDIFTLISFLDENLKLTLCHVMSRIILTHYHLQDFMKEICQF